MMSRAKSLAGRVLPRLRRRISVGLSGGEIENTEEIVWLKDIGLAAPGRNYYGPSGYSFLRRGLRGLPISSDDVFVDYGAGKGRIVIQAALRYPFRKVIGVELSEELLGIARENVAREQDRFRAVDVELVAADATTWLVPDDVTVAYMYKPFFGEVFETVIRRLIESLDRCPRTLTLIYANPEQDEFVLRTGRFKRTRVSKGIPGNPPYYWIHVYTSVDGERHTADGSASGSADDP